MTEAGNLKTKRQVGLERPDRRNRVTGNNVAVRREMAHSRRPTVGPLLFSTTDRPGKLTCNFTSFEVVVDAGADLAAKSRLYELVSEAAAPTLR